MPRLLTVLLVSGILGLGIAIGLGARAVFDWSGARQTAGAVDSGPPVATPLPVAPAQAAIVAPAAPRNVQPEQPAAAPDVVVEVTESQLEQELTGMLVGRSLGATPLGDATIQTVTVQLRDSQIQVGGGARAGFLQAPFVAAGTIVPDGDGRPEVKVNHASVGGVDLPEAMRLALAETLQERVDGFLSDRSVRIRTIDIANGKMRVVSAGGS